MDHNSGQATVRRRGMLEANGEYQIHCDSDDWVEPDMYEKMYLKAVSTGADIVSCNFVIEKEGQSRIIQNSDSPDPRFHIQYKAHDTWWSLCCRLIRTRLIREHDIYPISGMNMWEDMYVNLRVYYFANHLSHIEEPLYHYDVTHPESIVSRRMEKDIIEQQVSCIINLETFFSNVCYDAGSFLICKKCSLKNKFIMMKETDFKGFVECFPEVLENPFIDNCIERRIWRDAANGSKSSFQILRLHHKLEEKRDSFIIRIKRRKFFRWIKERLL